MEKRASQGGGLLVYGIPNMKLDKDTVQRRVDLLAEEGIEFVTEANIGVDLDVNVLKANSDALVLAMGATLPRDLPIAGREAKGVHFAMEFLTKNQKRLLMTRDGTLESEWGEHITAEGKDVIVIGGGDTAMDCVRTAVRQGAASVKCLYRRDRENMPGSRTEVAHAEEEGVEFLWLSGPASIEGGERAEKVQANRMQLGEPDADGRRRPVVDPSSSFALDADLVILALGFEPEPLPAIFGETGLNVDQWGTLECDENMMTSLPGVFAGGDIARGASLVVWAVRDGRDVAEHIEAYLAAERKPSAAAA